MKITRTIALLMWFIASIFYSYQYILRVMPSIMMHDIMQQFHINTMTFGQFSGVYYICYALMHLPIGIALDRYGPKKVMSLCILITALGSLPIILSDYWLYLIAGRILIGMGSSAAILSVFKIIRLVFAQERFTRMLSFSVMIGLIGAIYGGGPVNYMCSILGYKAVTLFFISMGVLLSIVTYFIVPNITIPQSTSILSDIREVFGNKKIMLICCLAGLMVGPLEGFADVWGGRFLQQVYGFEPSFAIGFPSIIFVGLCFGAPVLSFIAEKKNNYLATIISAAIIMTMSFTLLLSGKLSIQFMSLLFIITGICCSYQTYAIYIASTYVRASVVGLTTAVANMIIMVFGYLFHSVIGWIISIFGGVNNPRAFSYGIATIPIALAIGGIGFTIIYLEEKRQRLVLS
jgi:predicted MFS family arabinose efflux permease